MTLITNLLKKILTNILCFRQRRQGESIRRSSKRKLKKQIEILEAQLTKEKSKTEKYKKRYYRAKKESASKSPRTKVNALLARQKVNSVKMCPSDLSVIFSLLQIICSPLKKHFYSCSTVECLTFTVHNDVQSLTLEGHINVSFWASLFSGCMQVEWIKTSLFN